MATKLIYLINLYIKKSAKEIIKIEYDSK